MLKQILAYKHDTTRYYGNTDNLIEVKSKHYKNMFYILDGYKLVATVGLDTIATDNHRIAKGLDKGATATELEMWQDEQSTNNTIENITRELAAPDNLDKRGK